MSSLFLIAIISWCAAFVLETLRRFEILRPNWKKPPRQVAGEDTRATEIVLPVMSPCSAGVLTRAYGGRPMRRRKSRYRESP